MNIKTASAMAALLLVVGVQNVEARNPAKGGGGSTPSNNVLFSDLAAQCNYANSQASASFQNVSGVGETVQLSINGNAVASTNVEGLNNVNYTMLGAINFNVRGASINTNNFVVTAFFTAPGDNVITPRYCTFADGGIQQQGGSSTAYFIGVNHRNGNTQIPAGSRINGIQVQLKGPISGPTGTVTNNISNMTFTAFPGVGYDLSSPAAFCPLF